MWRRRAPARPFSLGMVVVSNPGPWPTVVPGEHREAPMRAWHSQPAVPMPGWQQRRPTPQTAPRGQALPRAPGDGRGLLFWSSLVNAYAKAAPLVGFTCRLQIERRTPSRWPGRSLSIILMQLARDIRDRSMLSVSDADFHEMIIGLAPAAFQQGRGAGEPGTLPGPRAVFQLRTVNYEL